MATHMDFHTSESLPKQFLPPRPTAPSAGLRPDYTGSQGMSTLTQMSKANVDSRKTNQNDDDDIEPLPMYRRITPVVYNRRDLTSLTDPDLCVTPEKRSPIKKTMINKSKTLNGDGLSELRTSKVRFDQVVRVKHLSPEQSESCDIIDIDRTGDTNRELSFDCNNARQFNDNSENEDDHEENSECKDQIRLLVTQTTDFSFEPGTAHDDQDIFVNTMDSEPHSIMRRKIAKCSPDKQIGDSDMIIDVKAQKMESAKKLVLEDTGSGEHILARPEFNSTLGLGQEVHDMENLEVDIKSAIAERLKKSNKARTKLDENTYAVLNRGGPQFSEIFSVEVQEEDLIELAAQEKGAKAVPAHRPWSQKPEDRLSRAPDIMDFYTPDLQPEMPSFSLSHISTPPNKLKTADPLSAFDTYHHIRAWEEW